MKPLFIAGCPRSGTTSLTDYLNRHPEILVCRERYKYVPRKVKPELLDFDRILDYRENETNISLDHHRKLLASKRSDNLKWIGDKYPLYFRHFSVLAKNNPQARFLMLYRPVEEVAESFEARARDPDDPWPEENGFSKGIELWNSALTHTRRFKAGAGETRVLIVSYRDFFSGDDACIDSISQFLNTDFDERLRQKWRDLSVGFTKRKRNKEALSEAQTLLIKAHKDQGAEDWALACISAQKDAAAQGTLAQGAVKAHQIRNVSNLERQLKEQVQKCHRLQRHNHQLTEQVQSLTRQVLAIQSSRSWRILRRLADMKSTIRRIGALTGRRKKQPGTSAAGKASLTDESAPANILEGADKMPKPAVQGNSIAAPGSPPTSSDSSARVNNHKRREEMVKRLMLVRRWSYLRYLHLREGLVCAEGVRSVLAVGCGRGYAEVALALEFPEMHFHLTDIEGERTPNYQKAQNLARTWELPNVTFGVRDILAREPARYDLVTSVEVLEHIEKDAVAAAEMLTAADKYVFALVPFADKAANADQTLRSKVWETHEHYRVGYDEEDLRQLFPRIKAMRGCYWRDRGGVLRKRLHEMTDDQIKGQMAGLRAEATHDLVEAVPRTFPEAQGIWMLARAGNEVSNDL